MRHTFSILIGSLVVFLLFLFFVPLLAAQQLTVEHTKARRHRSAQDRVLVDKVGVLTFDDTARKLKFHSGAGDDLDVAYDDITKVIFEVTTHMRGGALSEVVGAFGGEAIAAKHVNDYWFYVEYKQASGSPEDFLMEVQKESSEKVIDKAMQAFGPRVTVAKFPEKPGDINKEELKALQSKDELEVNKQKHPLPEIKPDKALVVVVCPPLAARYSGTGTQFKLHANDRVIAVNRRGTYSFAYLDPGKYRLVSQSENASGFEMQLEAGKDYYFLQNTFMGAWKLRTRLSRNGKELVMYELDGAQWSDWKQKDGSETTTASAAPKGI